MSTNTQKTEESANFPEEVTSLPEFMHWVTTAKAKTKAEKGKLDKLEFFYRGHSNCAYKLQPGVYREDAQGKSYRDHEHHLYQEMLRRNIAAFAEDKTTFERLVRMQHYELPTRLLDLTLNPLVALYFACKDHQGKKDGEVFLFSPKRLNVLNPSAISEGALVGLDREVDLFKNLQNIYIFLRPLIMEIINNKKGVEFEFLKFYFRDFLIKEDYIMNLCFELNSSKLIDSLREIFKKIETNSPPINKLIEFNKNKHKKFETIDFIRFYSSLIDDTKNAINKCIENTKNNIFYIFKYDSISSILSGLVRINYIYPPLNNERIQRQQGAFLIVPPLNPDELFNNTFYHSIKINKNSKKTILKELENYGITESYLFPEPVKQAQHIKEMYAPKNSPANQL